MIKESKTFRAYAVSIGILGILYLMRELFPSVILALSYPSAKLTSLFLSAPLVRGEALSYIIPHGVMGIHVVESCSGYNFWVLLVSCSLYLVVSRGAAKRKILYSMLVLPVSYCAAVCVNTARILSAFYLACYAGDFMPPGYGAVIHLLIGVMIFLPFLVISYAIFQRRLENEQ